MARGRINAPSKNLRPGNSQHATSQALETPIRIDSTTVPNNKMLEPFRYRPSTVSRKCSQFSAGLEICQITPAIGRKMIMPINKAETVQMFSLKRNSCFRLRNQYCAIVINENTKPTAAYSQPARSNSFTASLFLAPNMDRFTLSALNAPQLLSNSEWLLSSLTGYS